MFSAVGDELTSHSGGRADVLKYSWMEQPQPDSSAAERGGSSGDMTPAVHHGTSPVDAQGSSCAILLSDSSALGEPAVLMQFS